MSARRRRRSAGLLPFRVGVGGLEVFIAHMGGPFWAKKDDGGFSIVKGEHAPGEDALAAARREFEEETGVAAPSGDVLELGEVRQPSGKLIAVWAVESPGFELEAVHSNTFTMEWPRGSGAMAEFPEIDRAGWFDAQTARRKLVKGQVPFLDALERVLAVREDEAHAATPG